MIYSNLAGTTNKSFTVGRAELGNGMITPNGQILCNNAYDFYWATNNSVTNSRNQNVIELVSGTDLNNINRPGQYYRPYSTVALVNSPTIYEFTMTVEPSSGNDLNWLIQKITDTIGAEYVRYRRNSEYSNWWRIAAFHELPVQTTGNWTPTVSSGYTISNIANNTYIRYGRFCYINVYFILKKTSAQATLYIGGMPFPVFYGQMNGGIIIADEFAQSLTNLGETITTLVPDFPVPAPESSNTFRILAQTYTDASTNSVSNTYLDSIMVPNVNLHVQMSLIYTVVA